ncbi:uncharacterized protein [Blastocystis hominis]|uniref:Calponin-homology (CH) domain-containing protein n=1 Tax=Blastocystis hominis TaxID=12968 RepID=D8M8I0_BLAHO|nr:uncharacterized protein [Blastocystis hominis]CBK24369.2 unnamed protein product [Blastocystis hominis]|eukprot:XP_012898417.1 uncharacterized protein [Blastocystis hominis]
MEAATGASRSELLEWINSTLHLNLHKIEETASGAVACQIINLIFPDTVPIQRVNTAAKDPYEYSKNYKILQAAFVKNKIEKNIDVEKLMKGRPQDNLEFMQWLKRFYDLHQNGMEKRSSSHRSYHSVASSSPSSQGEAMNSPSCSLFV